jgi:signal transduction histidine kinase
VNSTMAPPPATDDSPEAVARDFASVNRIAALPGMLEILCRNTGMGFAAVARTTAAGWIACAVRDSIGFGLLPGGWLEVGATLRMQAREDPRPIAVDHATGDAVYQELLRPEVYGVESYASAPIMLADGSYFGDLCAVDPSPARVSDAATIAAFLAYAQLIANELDRQAKEDANEASLIDERSTSLLREQFIAVLGHDLRNPLAAVTASAEVLIHRGPAADAIAIGRRIKASAKRMSRLIDDVLDFARGRLGSGIGARMAVEADLGAALMEVALESGAAHPEREIKTRIDIARPVRCDLARAQQLLSNMLGNAIHHGAPGEPIVVEATADEGELAISVSNGGRGIAAEHLAKVFEPYWRPPTSEPGGGLGLGLHICSQIAVAHGGRMEVVSTPGGLTTFTGRIPLEPADLSSGGRAHLPPGFHAIGSAFE